MHRRPRLGDGPQLHRVRAAHCGATSVFYEGAPTYPDPGRLWSIVEKYGVTILYTAPTAIRGLMRHGDEWPAKYDLSSLRLLGSVGEPINPEAWMWYRGDRRRALPHHGHLVADGDRRAPDHAEPVTPLKPGSATRPFLGIEADVVDKNGQPVPARRRAATWSSASRGRR